jgi:hypothetical protein
MFRLKLSIIKSIPDIVLITAVKLELRSIMVRPLSYLPRAVASSPTYFSIFPSMAVPWLRRLVASLSPWRPGFDIRSVHVEFVVDKVALGQVFPPSTSVFPCQFHSTGTPLHGKIKKKSFSSQGCTISLKAVLRP